MLRRKTTHFITFFLFSALLVGGPLGGAGHTWAAEKAATAKTGQNIYKGKILGKSNKAKTISIKVGKKTEMVKFDDRTKGIEHAKKGEAAIIKFERRGKDRFATLIKPKLAKLPKGVTEMQPGELAEFVALGPEKGKYLLVDSRPAGRYNAGHIPTAVSIPFTELKKNGNAALPAKAGTGDIQLIFYCGGPTCGLSTKSAGLAKKMGHANIKVMLQGAPGWKKAGHYLLASKKHVAQGNIILLDLRSSAAYQAGHIPRAHNIPLADLEDSADDIPSLGKAPIVVYSGNDEEAARGYRRLADLGCKKGSVWRGGPASWRGKLEKGPGPEEIVWKRKLGKGEIGVADFMKAVHGKTDQIVLDVRTNEEAASGMFKNAIHIPLDELEGRLAELPRDKELLIHCATGDRASMAWQACKKAGITARFLVAAVECEDGGCEIDD